MILLDTCILLRVTDDAPLPAGVRSALEAEPWAVSVLSAWEIGIKYALGKLPLDAPADRWWPRVVHHYRVTVLPFSDRQALAAANLPQLHADPFDRGIISTGIDLNLTVATVDPWFAGYVVPTGLRLAS